MTIPYYNYYIGGSVRVIDSHSPYQQGEVLKVSYMSERDNGEKFLGFHDYLETGSWASFHFEPVALSETDEYVREVNAGPTIQVDLKDYNELLIDAQYWAAAVNCKIQNWCDFPDLIAEFTRLEKEE